MPGERSPAYTALHSLAHAACGRWEEAEKLAIQAVSRGGDGAVRPAELVLRAVQARSGVVEADAAVQKRMELGKAPHCAP
jgi:hypothetical protein